MFDHLLAQTLLPATEPEDQPQPSDEAPASATDDADAAQEGAAGEDAAGEDAAREDATAESAEGANEAAAPIVVQAPEAGESLVVTPESGVVYQLAFSLQAATVQRDGNDLIFVFAGTEGEADSRIVFLNIAGSGGGDTPPAFQIAGEFWSPGDLFAGIDALTGNDTPPETAASPESSGTQGSGATAYNEDLGDSLGSDDNSGEAPDEPGELPDVPGEGTLEGTAPPAELAETETGDAPEAPPPAVPEAPQALPATLWTVGFGESIQAAVDAAEAGDTIEIAAGFFSENVVVDKALNFVGQGSGATFINANGGSGFTLVGDLGAGSTVSFSGLTIALASDYGIAVNGTTLGTLEISDSVFLGNSRNGLGIVDGQNLGSVAVSASSFFQNGHPHGSSGDGDLLFYQFNGAATLSDLIIDGGSRPIDSSQHDPDHAAENAIQFRSDSGALGDVTLEGIVIAGSYEKVGIAFYNYDNVDGLAMTDVGITAETGWQLSMNFSGIDGDIDLSQFAGLTYAQVAALQGGSGAANVLVGDDQDNYLAGGGGGDLLTGGGGDDILVGGAGSDGLEGGSGADIFVYTSVADAGDFITGFDATGVDTIDVDALLDSLAVDDANRAARVQVLQGGTDQDAVISVDTTNDGVFDTVLANVTDVTGDLDQGDLTLGTLA